MKLRRSIWLAVVIIACVTLGWSSLHAKKAKAPDPVRGKALYKKCESCHGAQAQGNQDIKTPALAGLSGWYLNQQMMDFRNGARGAHAKDLYGRLMAAVSKELKAGDIQDVVAYIQTLKPRPQRTLLKGNVSRGESHFRVCASCHGGQAQGNKQKLAPSLVHLQDWYLRKQILNFGKGFRTYAGKGQSDHMQALSKIIKQQNAAVDVVVDVVVDLVVYIKSIKKIHKGDYFNGKRLYKVCLPCHGASGQGNHYLQTPAIAGQKGWYITQQIKHFQSGVRGKHKKDIYGQMMRPMALSLKNTQEIKDVVAYVSTFKPRAHKTTVKGDVKVGKQYYENGCVVCHGKKAEGNKLMGAPSLADQQDWYLVRQIQFFREGIRGAHAKDKRGRLMTPIAKSLKDPKVISDIVAYIKSLHTP